MIFHGHFAWQMLVLQHETSRLEEEITGMGALFHFLNELKTLPIQPVWSVIGLCTDSLTHAFLLLSGHRSTCSSSFHEIESNKPIQKIKHASNLTWQRENSPVSYKGRNMLLFHPIIGANKAPGEDGPCQIPRGEVFLLKELREANCYLRCESWRQRWHFWWTKYLNNKHNIRMTINHNIITSIKIRCLSFAFLFIMSIIISVIIPIMFFPLKPCILGSL